MKKIKIDKDVLKEVFIPLFIGFMLAGLFTWYLFSIYGKEKTYNSYIKVVVFNPDKNNDTIEFMSNKKIVYGSHSGTNYIGTDYFNGHKFYSSTMPYKVLEYEVVETNNR